MNATVMRLLGVAILASRVLTAAACEPAAQAVHLNQLGFASTGPKTAVVVIESADPVDWQLVGRDGRKLAGGRTRRSGADALSGQSVHTVDFSHYQGRGDGLQLRVACADSLPFGISSNPYRQLAYDALAYFYHSRSGVPIEARLVGAPWARPAAHTSERVTCREGVDDKGKHWPACPYTLDVTGGWYDAGDQGKYVVNGGISVWTLLNLYERQQLQHRKHSFADGSARLPESDNGVNDLLDEARVEMQFLLSMQVPEGQDAAGMAHHKVADVNWTPLPTPPHRDREQRVLYPASTAATLNLAATAAQCARIWRSVDAAFAARCLEASQRAFAAAQRSPAVYFTAAFSGSGMYGDSKLADEFFWAAAELAITTGNPEYFEALHAAQSSLPPVSDEPSWSAVATLGWISLALARELPATQSQLQRQARDRIIAAADRYVAERDASGYRLVFRGPFPWGSNSNALNRAVLLALAHDFTGNLQYRNAVIDALDYLLGRNPLGQSYVSGYGERTLHNPHHRFWAHSLDAALPGPPAGVLSGGPNSVAPADPVARELKAAGCAPLMCWRDDLQAYSLNEVAINWNAPLVWVAAFADEAFNDAGRR